MRYEKFGINGQLRNKLILIVIRRFPLVKAAMNAPRMSKLRNGVKDVLIRLRVGMDMKLKVRIFFRWRECPGACWWT